MKNLKVKIGLVSVLIIGIAITGFLYSCEKEDKKETTKTQAEISESLDKDYQTYIDELMAKTGVDIYALSQLSEVKKVAEQNIRMRESFEKQSTKGGLTDEKFIQIEKLTKEIEAKYNAGDEGAVAVLFESLYNICKTIDGFDFYTDEYGLQAVTYDPNKPAVNLPIRQLETQQLQATRLMTEVRATSVEFTRLSESLQVEVLAATMVVSGQSLLLDSKTASKAFSSNDLGACLQAANNAYDIDLAAAKAIYIFGLSGCLPLGPWGGAICVMVNTGIFAYGAVCAENTLRISKENCNLKYGR